MDTGSLRNNFIVDRLVNFRFVPDKGIWELPDFNSPFPERPFDSKWEWLNDEFYPLSLTGIFVFLFAITYFTSVHISNKFILSRQIKLAKSKNPKFDFSNLSEYQIKKLPAAPFAFTKTTGFRTFIVLHNVFLFLYSLWTFIGMTTSIHKISHHFLPYLYDTYWNINLSTLIHKNTNLFWQAVCDIENGIWFGKDALITKSIEKGLSYYGYWFYLSKFYEIIDTFIILVKGKQSSLLQSYHHSGAMICMWAGVRFSSPPIWIFVVFNSFIHTLMYFYFTLSALKIKVPNIFRKILTTMQITQFVIGGSLAVFHLFVQYYDVTAKEFKSCISTGAEAAAIWINVLYLTPLTVLFAAFWIENYARKSAASRNSAKKNN